MTEDNSVVLARIEAKVDSIDVHIRGNGKPGINLRLDRIEQREAGRVKLVWLATAAAVSALAGSIKGWLR